MMNSRSFPAKWLPLIAKVAESLEPLLEVGADDLELEDMFIRSVEVVIWHSDDYQVGTFHLEDDWFMYNPGGDE